MYRESLRAGTISFHWTKHTITYNISHILGATLHLVALSRDRPVAFLSGPDAGIYIMRVPYKGAGVMTPLVTLREKSPDS